MSKTTKIPANLLNLFINNSDEKVEQDIISLGNEINVKRKESRLALKVLLYNFYASGKKRVITPRDKKPFGSERYNPHGMGYKAYITALQGLLENGYIDQELGYKDKKTWDGVSTTSWAKRKLIQYFNDCQWSENPHWNFKYHTEYVLLRENVKRDRWDKRRKNDKLLDYKDSDYSIKLRKALKEYNELINQSQIQVIKTNKAGVESISREFNNLHLTRKFIQHASNTGEVLLSYGGRMYAPWCDLSSIQRKHIRINGNKTIELDLEASAINMVYLQMTGKRYPEGDPYHLEFEELGAEIPRESVKRLTNMMFNNETMKAAVMALESYFNPSDNFDDNRSQKDKKDMKAYNQMKNFISPSQLGQMILEKHQLIDKYFLQGKKVGDLILCYESDRVFEIIRRFTQENIPVLTVYDSFIVEEKHQDKLMELMDRMYPLSLV